MKKQTRLLLLSCIVAFASMAQKQKTIPFAMSKFRGEWHNTKGKNVLYISYDTDVAYATINNDPKDKRYSIDVYKAFPKGNKLIMPADNNEHHCSYSEMSIENNKLIIRTNDPLDDTTQYIKPNKHLSIETYQRKRK